MGVAMKRYAVGIWTIPVVVELEPGHGETVHGPEQALHYLLIRWPAKRGARHEQACMVTAMCVEGHGGLAQAREAFIAAAVEAVLRRAIHCCRNFGTVSIVGVFGGFVDKIPMSSAINRGLTFRMAQTPVQHYLPILLERIERGDIDPSFVITHRAGLEQGPELYKTFRDKKDGCIKVVLKP